MLGNGHPESLHGVHMSRLSGKQLTAYVGVYPDDDRRVSTSGEYLAPGERFVDSIEFSDGGAG